MKVCVLGLWHLGTVVAACLASRGHEVVGLDVDETVVARLREGIPPLFEPGLAELVRKGIASGRLSFTTTPAEAVAGADLLWVAYDTPVDEDDRADVSFVTEGVRRIFPFISNGTVVLVSSQLPVGTVSRIARDFADARPDVRISFACSPENLRLGKAIKVFLEPDRVVAGVDSEGAREKVTALFAPITDRIVWMSVESAEMTKHAINAFLAMSVAFANEVAVLCERAGADAKEVERGLKSEARIGPGAYLSPGGAFAGGTLARDVEFLKALGNRTGRSTPLLSGIGASNDLHKVWAREKVREALGDLRGKTIAVWGLTYKPGTDTLRRSTSVELCRWLSGHGATVRGFDPAVKDLPADLAASITLCAASLDALSGASALVVATEWPEFREVSAEAVVTALITPVVVDANRFLGGTLGVDARVRYAAVGAPS